MLRNAIAGGTAGAFASFATCPLDVVKTRMQYIYPPPYKSTMNGLAQIYHQEGHRGWYRGLSATIAGYLPSWATYFMVYEGSKHYFNPYFPSTSTTNHILSAITAGITSTVLTNPFWVVKTRFMATVPPIPSLRLAFKQIYMEEGFLAYYKGLATSLLGISHAAIQFPLYEIFKNLLSELSEAPPSTLSPSHLPSPSTLIPSSTIFISSCLSKMLATMVTYPHEVIRTRLHMQKDKHSLRYLSIRHCAMSIYQSEGLSAFYRGLSTNLLRTVPNSVITLYTYERVAHYLNVWCNDLKTA
ncbi:hypothetical protein HMI55_000758 [Coelomomyces lativittatus]|nr:hypothetical protein HMI55_000758 [Coelomomyces lativittatus]